MNSNYQQSLALSKQRLRSRVAAVAGTVLLAAGIAACAPSAASGPIASAPTGAPVAATAAAVQPATAVQAATSAPTARPAAVATATGAGAASTAASSPASTAAAPTTPVAAAQASTVTKLNLNTATAAEFLKVPGVGNQMLREFQEYKPYTSILQFRREIGKYVDAQTVAAYEQYVYVPISVASADAATLQQIPGLDATEAAALIAGRPYASGEAFLSKLAGYVSPAELAAARSYLGTP